MYPLIKRFFDLLFSIVVFGASMPLFLVVCLLLFIANKGKVFFFQERAGFKSRIFKVIKFKTMTDEKDDQGNLLDDNDRLTKVGKFVRETSLDELPQLFNVIKGDMSIVGPRPFLAEYLSLYNQKQQRRHDVRPGITGWAQVNGRNTISWEQKFDFDVWYVDNYSFGLDLKIIRKTIVKVFKSEDINSGNTTTMDKFTGS